MAKLALLLALTQSTLIHGLPARDEAHDVYINRAISILSDIGVTTVYSSAMPTLQSASMSETPTLTGVSFDPLHLQSLETDIFTGHSNEPTGPGFQSRTHQNVQFGIDPNSCAN